MTPTRIGIDVGGTFTDFTVVGAESGEPLHFKVLSTPEDPSLAIEDGLRQIVGAGYQPAGISYLGHGTTVATNMVIERAGAKVGLITTKGHRDVLEIRRQQRPHLFDYSRRYPEPIVPRYLRLEIGERVSAQGDVLTALDEWEVRRAAEIFAREKVESVAVCFLHAYRFPEHEHRAEAILRNALPGVPISVSSRVQPEFREFERFSTTVVNAFLAPRMREYLTLLETRCEGLGIAAKPYTVHSNGGLMSTATAAEFPVRTCLSGPAAGVVGAALVASAAGFANAVTFDVGGTSTDVSLIVDGRIDYSLMRDVSGYPLRCPMINVQVIGAGGGSIAWLDDAGALKVGPKSASADPGPAGYGRGGTGATLTDANIVLGRLNPVALLDGALVIDRSASSKVVRTIADRLAISDLSAAVGIVRIAVANMARAIRGIAAERGRRLGDLTLVAFGGAGPLHAAAVADECGISEILIPFSPGTMCARGVLLSNVSQSFVHTALSMLSPDNWPSLLQEQTHLIDTADKWLDCEGIRGAARQILCRIEGRYKGQNHEVSVDLASPDLDEVVDRFHGANEEIYGHSLGGHPIEVVNIRVTAVGLTGIPIVKPSITGNLTACQPMTRNVAFDAANFVAAAVYRRESLLPAATIIGPAVIEERTATTIVPPGWSVTVDDHLNIILRKMSGQNV